MSTEDQPSESAAPERARPEPKLPVSPRRVREPRARGGGSLALALLLGLVAVGASGYVGWQQWQQMQGHAADSAGLNTLQQRMTVVETSLGQVSSQRASLDQQLEDAAQVNRSLRSELLSQSERTRRLEDAVAKLADKTLSGHDAMLLDETESLLRMGGERYALFNDAQSAVTAFTLADQTLAAVDDGAFSGLRQSIDAERDALIKSQPANQVAALQQLLELRSTLAELPLKPLDDGGKVAATGAWSRIGHALAGVISVQRDNGAPLAVADARFARELAMLDVAQAQAALLAYDNKAYAAALQRVDVSLSSQFDEHAEAVKKAHLSLQQLAEALPATAPVTLGAALIELHNLRAVHALKLPASAPASSSTTAAAGVQP